MPFPASTKIQHKRATAAEWTSDNTVLLSGEIGIESDTNLAKAGNGSDGWNDLPYISGTKTYEGYTSAAAFAYITIAYCLPASLNKNAILEIEAQDSSGHITKVFLFLTVAVDSSYVTSSRIEISGVCSQGHATNSGYWILDYLRVGYEHVGAKHIIQIRKKTAATLTIKTTSYLFNDWVIREGDLDFTSWPTPAYSQVRYLTPGSLVNYYYSGVLSTPTYYLGTNSYGHLIRQSPANVLSTIGGLGSSHISDIFTHGIRKVEASAIPPTEYNSWEIHGRILFVEGNSKVGEVEELYAALKPIGQSGDAYNRLIVRIVYDEISNFLSTAPLGRGIIGFATDTSDFFLSYWDSSHSQFGWRKIDITAITGHMSSSDEHGYSFGTVRPSTCDAGDRFLETDVEVLSGAVGSNTWKETPLLNSNPGSRIKNVSADYSMLKENIFLLVNSSASSVVITLPDPSTCYPGQLYTIKNVGYSVSYDITIEPYDTEKIDNQSGDIVLSASEGEAVTLMTDGTDWYITSNYSGEYT